MRIRRNQAAPKTLQNSRETREIENKEQTSRKEFENKEQAASEQGANRSIETKEFECKEQTARKELEKFRTRSKPIERN